MQVITITGGVGRDAELRTAGQSKVCSFSVGVSQGWGDKKQTNWYRCNLWGKRGESVSQYLLKGVKVAVQGEISIGEYDGKPQYEINVNEVDIMSKREGSPQHKNNDGFDGNRPAGLEDSIPF